jgi:hypothetical protein
LTKYHESGIFIFMTYDELPYVGQHFPESPDTGVSYGGSRNLFRNAAESFGVDLLDQEDYDWLVVMGAAMLVDHLIDVEGLDINSPFQDIIDGNLREDLHPDLQIRAVNYMRRQNPQQRAVIFDSVALVDELSGAQRKATKPNEVVDIRLAEADVLAQLLSLETGKGSDSHARIKLNKWISSWSRTGYLLDSLADIKTDYSTGQSGVYPSIWARLIYATAASRESIAALSRTPPSLLGKCAMSGVNYVVKQRRVNVQASSQDQ